MIKILFYLVVLGGWWLICFGIDILTYKLLLKSYQPSIKRKIRIITYGLPFLSMLTVGLIVQNLVVTLIFVSTILLAVFLDFLDGFVWAMYESQPGML